MKRYLIRSWSATLVLGFALGIVVLSGCGTSVSTTPQGGAPEEQKETPEYVQGEEAIK